MKGFSVTNVATLTRTLEVTETIVVKESGMLLELSLREAEGLAKLLRGGVGNSTLAALGISEVMRSLKAEGLGDKYNHDNHWVNWETTAQWKGPKQ